MGCDAFDGWSWSSMLTDFHGFWLFPGKEALRNYLPSPLTLGSSSLFTRDFLRAPAVIFFSSATVPRDSWGNRDLDG